MALLAKQKKQKLRLFFVGLLSPDVLSRQPWRNKGPSVGPGVTEEDVMRFLMLWIAWLPSNTTPERRTLRPNWFWRQLGQSHRYWNWPICQGTSNLIWRGGWGGIGGPIMWLPSVSHCVHFCLSATDPTRWATVAPPPPSPPLNQCDTINPVSSAPYSHLHVNLHEGPNVSHSAVDISVEAFSCLLVIPGLVWNPPPLAYMWVWNFND